MTTEEFYDKLDCVNHDDRIPEEVIAFAAKSYGENEDTLEHLAYYYYGQSVESLVSERREDIEQQLTILLSNLLKKIHTKV